jgi:S-DNA-T family DNA segregation ATPase FtsK/SpoIIIE
MARISNKYNEETKGSEGKKKRKKKASAKSDAAKPKKSFDLLKPFRVIFDVKNKKTNRIVGALLLLTSVYLLLAFISYLFTWKVDQNFVVGKGLFTFLFDGTEIELGNHLGKLGAWLSHQFIFSWFGLASFLFPFVFSILGVFLLFRVTILPLKKTTLRSIVGGIVLSLVFGFFASGDNFPYGGAFGYQFNSWLKVAVGTFGALLFHIVLVYIAVVVLFNPNLKALYAKF